MSRHVLITRPIEDAQEIAKLVAGKNYQTTCEPFLDIIYHDKNISNTSDYNGLIVTSANAIRAFCANSEDRSLPVFTVGDYTAFKAKELGFRNVQSASGKVADLINMIDQATESKRYLYVRGQYISKPFKIGDSQIEIKEVVLYHSEKREKISESTLSLLAEGLFSHILFFSKRTAESFIDIVQDRQELREALKSSKALCLGDSMVQCLSVLPWGDVRVANSPNREGILALLDD